MARCIAELVAHRKTLREKMAGNAPGAEQSRPQAESDLETDVSQRCWLPDGEAIWLHDIHVSAQIG